MPLKRTELWLTKLVILSILKKCGEFKLKGQSFWDMPLKRTELWLTKLVILSILKKCGEFLAKVAQNCGKRG